MPTLRLVAAHQLADGDNLDWDLDVLSAWLIDPSPLSSLDRAGASALIRDLSFAFVELLAGRRARAVVPTEAAPLSGQRRKGAVWEIGLERDTDKVFVTLFRQGADAEVAQAHHPVAVETARRSLLAAVAAFPVTDRGLALARESLLACSAGDPSGLTVADRRLVTVASTRRAAIELDAELCMRRFPDASPSEVARADLHALLIEGTLRARVGSSERVVEDVHVFLFAELLVGLAADAVAARAANRGMLRRQNFGDTRVGLQLDELGAASLMLGGKDGYRLPPVPSVDFVRAVVSFGRRLAKQILTADRSQKANLRLTAFRRAVRDLVQRLRGSAEGQSVLNGSPERYRAFAESDSQRPASAASGPPAVGKLRFSQSWRADVPGLDLRSIFLVNDRIIVSASREVACIERTSGQLLWTRPSRRAVSIMTPVGLARLGADGRLSVHDASDGDSLFEVQLGPCVGASASGAVVDAPGLPHMLLVGEGARHLVAVDLDSSEIRWRRAVRSRSEGAAHRPLRLRRAGRLMLVSGGESQLLAVDLLTGEVVWRHSGRHRYRAVSVDRGAVFAFSSEVSGRPGRALLERLDPWSGEVRWRASMPRASVILGAPRPASQTVMVLTRDDDRDVARTGVIGFDRETGEVRYDLPGGLCDGHAGCLVVDDVLLANSESGELVAIESADGNTRYRHVFAGWSSRFHPADRPRSVQPVLRSGALFLPQTEVYVVRPADGAMLGRLPADLVPDALRVDERCGVYVAEASGYVAAYHALPTLSVVKTR
jgi:outer membrane protein assembly factor BamB